MGRRDRKDSSEIKRRSAHTRWCLPKPCRPGGNSGQAAPEIETVRNDISDGRRTVAVGGSRAPSPVLQSEDGRRRRWRCQSLQSGSAKSRFAHDIANANKFSKKSSRANKTEKSARARVTDFTFRHESATRPGLTRAHLSMPIHPLRRVASRPREHRRARRSLHRCQSNNFNDLRHFRGHQPDVGEASFARQSTCTCTIVSHHPTWQIGRRRRKSTTSSARATPLPPPLAGGQDHETASPLFEAWDTGDAHPHGQYRVGRRVPEPSTVISVPLGQRDLAVGDVTLQHLRGIRKASLRRFLHMRRQRRQAFDQGVKILCIQRQ